MSYTGFYGQGSSIRNNGTSPLAGNNNRKTSSTYNNLIPRQKIVNPIPGSIRTELPDSEPMSELTEVPMSLTMMLPAPFQQIQARPRNSVQVQSSPRPLVMHTQRTENQEIRLTPYSHPARVQFPVGTPQLLLPSPSPHCLAANYNSDQTFVMHSTTPPAAARGLATIEENRVLPALDTSPANISKSGGKSLTKGAAKLSSVKRRRFFVGTTDQLVRWHKMAKQVEFHAIYEVSAILESISCSPSGAYRMILRNDQKNCALPLQAVFFPIDKNLPKVKAQDLVTCIGRMIGTNKFHVYNLWPTTSENLAGLKRISFFCQRTLQEASLSAPEP